MQLRTLRFILTIAVIIIATNASAQNIERMRHNLASRTVDGARVSVEEDGSTRDAVKTIESLSRPKQVNGYRIVIYSDNGQGAGDNAKKVHTTFKNTFPHINAYLVYESPYFKVSVGDCLTMEEAQILMAKITPHYPKAFPKREVIKLSELQNVRSEIIVATDSLMVESPGDKAQK